MILSHIPESIRGDPWFEDGNIILVAEAESVNEPEEGHTQDQRADEGSINAVAFRVHRGVLSRHSEVFQSMFEVAQPPAENVEACPVVRLYDLPNELSNLIKAIYDGAHGLDTESCRGIEQFFYLAGVLRLSTKYCIMHLRAQAIRHLTQTWAYTLRGHDEMLQRALSTPEDAGLSYPYVHPLHVLNLARENDVRIIVPSALYFLSLYPLADIINGDHPKLNVQHPSRPSSRLTAADMQAYTLMFQHRLQLILGFIRKTCGARFTAEDCRAKLQCKKSFAQLSNRLSREWALRTGPIHFMTQAVDELIDFPDVCNPCISAFKRDVQEAREGAWESLPLAVGLPSWDQLAAADFAKS